MGKAGGPPRRFIYFSRLRKYKARLGKQGQRGKRKQAKTFYYAIKPLGDDDILGDDKNSADAIYSARAREKEAARGKFLMALGEMLVRHKKFINFGGRGGVRCLRCMQWGDT